MSGYIGNIPVPQATQTRQSFTATASQTTFNTAGYSPGYIDVFLNGVKLAPADYTATNGSDVVLAVGAASGDILETVAYEIFQVLDQDFTGDFTVDGSTFVVDSTNNRVGVGTASPSGKLDVIQGTTPSYFKHGTGTYLNITTGAANGTVDLKFDASSGSYPAATFYTSNTERMRIDSSGNVGIGTSSPSSYNSTMNDLVVAGSGDSGITIASGTTSEGSIAFADGTSGADAYRGWINYNHNSNFMRFSTNATERMRIGSSGNVGVGTTNPDDHTSAGVRLFNDGRSYSTVSGNFCFTANRLSSDGTLIRLQKDSTTVGSIGVDSVDNITFGATSGGGSGLYMFGAGGTSPFILPMKEGALSDNTVTLGDNARRFKDLYLSGGVYLGGTGSANKLDDYEEGSWTPTVTTGFTSPSYSIQVGYYTKIGNVVRAYFRLLLNGGTGTSSSVVLGGLPFTSSNLGSLFPVGTHYINAATAGGENSKLLVFPNANSIYLYSQDEAGVSGISGATVGSSFDILGQVIYQTDA